MPRLSAKAASSRNRRWRYALPTAAILAAAMALLLTSCYPGTYSLDVFPEMHYQASYRPYEPPRLSSPDGAVPISGRPLPAPDFAASATLRNPIPASLEATKTAEKLYRANCLPCHGPEGLGDGFVAQYFRRAELPIPVDFASARARSRADGHLYFIITNGLGNMPPFAKLLTPDERWYLVHFIRAVQAKNAPS